MNPVSIIYDTLTESFIYFSSFYNSKVIKSEVTTYNAIKRQISLANISFVNYSIVRTYLDKERNIIFHLKDSLSNSIILKTDQEKNLMWQYDFIRLDKQEIYEIKVSNTNNTILTGYDENHNVFETVLDDKGNEIITVIEQVQISNTHIIEDIIFSKNDKSYVAVLHDSGIKYIHYVKESINWQFSIPPSWSLVKYLKDINGNYVIFYNYNETFSFGGKFYSLFGQNSIGFIVVTEEGTIVENYTIDYVSTQILTDIELGRDNYIALTGYFSNHENVNLSTLENNQELCSFLVGLELKYNNISLRVEREENKIIEIIPNPTTDEINIVYYLKNEGEIDVEIRSYAGQVIIQKRSIAKKGNNTLSLSLGKDLPSGLYIINIRSSFDNVSERIIKI